MSSVWFLYVFWSIVCNLAAFEANPVDQNGCIHNETAADESGRGCINKRCSVYRGVCRGQRQCVCDGACGYRCISVANPEYCEKLPAPPNGSVVYRTGDRSHGAIAAYRCSSGFSLVDNLERTCLGDREWTTGGTPDCLPHGEICPRLVNTSMAGNESSCLPACSTRTDCPKKKQQLCMCAGDCGMSCLSVYVPGYCPDIELTEGTTILSVIPSGYMFTSVAIIGCEYGYEMDTEIQKITCLFTGQWSAQPARCTLKPLCSYPLQVENARHNSRSRTFSPGDTLTYKCSPGYHYYGNGEISTCLEDLSWTPVTMTCYAISCGNPGYLRNGWREGDLFTFLSRVIFHCNDGYERIGFAYRTCLANRLWSSIMPSCKAIECPAMFAPDHGTVQGTHYTYDEQIYFRCNHGYKLQGSAVRRCQDDKTWSGEEVSCTVIMCVMPETPEHGYMIAHRQVLNALVRYSCDYGYSLVGNPSARCTEEETWSQPTPLCKADCIVPNAPHNGYYARSYYDSFSAGQTVAHGTHIQVQCTYWYRLNSKEQYVCNDGQWSFHAKCDEAPCEMLADLHNGYISYEPEVNRSLSVVPHATRASYSCLYGFGGQTSINVTCGYSRWSAGTPPNCQAKSCDSESLLHGMVHYDPKGDPHHGTVRTFECSEGYTLDQRSLGQSGCDDGVWTLPVPNCQPNQCAHLTISDGTISNSKIQADHGDTVRLTCDRGLRPSVGDGPVHCHAGQWVPDGLTCIPNGESFNVAYGKPAEQSDTIVEGNNGNAIFAVDGDRNRDFHHGSCTNTRKVGSDLFWRVDLLDVYRIEKVVIYNRQDCCAERLTEASVHVGLSRLGTYQQCGNFISKSSSRGQQPIHVECSTDSLYGRYVTIKLPINKAAKMNLCEVEVFGTGPIITCGVPYFLSNLRVSLNEDQTEDLRVGTRVAAGMTVYYRCNEGYSKQGASLNHCLSNGIWESAKPTCNPAECDVDDPDNGRLEQSISRIEHNRIVAYRCETGYARLYDDVTCILGSLKPGPPQCVPQSCHIDASELSNILVDNKEPSADAQGQIVIPQDTSVTFSCREGFEDVTNLNTEALCSYGTLVEPFRIPSCKKVQCPDPPFVAHGSYSVEKGGDMTHRTLLLYQCDHGYHFANGDIHVDFYLRCNINGEWDNSVPLCQLEQGGDIPRTDVQECDGPSVPQALIYHNLQNIANTEYEIIFVDDDVITISCTTGFRISGQPTVTCNSGKWIPSLPRCEVSSRQSCRRPEKRSLVAQYLNGLYKLEDISLSISTFTHGAIITSRCRNPLIYKLQTTANRTCTDGNWIGPEPRCELVKYKFRLLHQDLLLYQYYANGSLLIYPGIGELSIECTVPARRRSHLFIPHNEHWQSVTPNGKTYGPPREVFSGIYSCDIVGQQDNTLSHTLDIQVRAVSCPEPDPLVNGRRIGDDFAITRSVSFECNEGYQLKGESKFKCNLGRWSTSPFPSCKSLNCPEIITDDLMIILVHQGTSVGSMVTFDCPSGYTLAGDIVLECQPGATWSNSIPHCEESVNIIATTKEPMLECGGVCEVWEICIGSDDGEMRCSCKHPSRCLPQDDDVLCCGTDGRQYTSICKLKATGCMFEIDNQVAYLGPCRIATTETPLDEASQDLAEDFSSSDSVYASSDDTVSKLDTNEHDGDITTLEPNTTYIHCQSCTHPDLHLSCQQSKQIFIGEPTQVNKPDVNTLSYSVTVMKSIAGSSLNLPNVTVTQAFQQCQCPVINISQTYLFVLHQDSHNGVFPVTSYDFVRRWDDFSTEFNNTCWHE